jgi:lipopolysaccharide export system permease protein
VLAAREAATGAPAPAPATLDPPEQRASPSLAAFYCQALGAFGVPEARAAVAQQRKVDSTPRVRAPSAGGAPADLPAAADLGERHAGGAAYSAAAIPLENTGLLESARGRVLDNDRTKDTFSVEIEKKFALSVACVVFVLFGAPIALRFPRGGVGLVIGVSMSVFALYYVGLIAGEELADRGVMSPFAAMWATNVLFTVVGLVLFSRMGREGATARGGDAGEFIDALKMWVAKQLRRVGVPVDRRARARA